MSPESVSRILAEYERIAPRADLMVAGFYRRLFDAYPDVRGLFRDDMTVQHNHFTATLALLVRNLAFQDLLEEAVMELGAQHVTWGARLHHYPAVKEALLASIGDALGDEWTDASRADWTALLDHVIATMRKGAARFAVQQAIAAQPNA